MGKITISNKSQTATFSYEADNYVVRGNVKTGDNDAITALEGGIVLKGNDVAANFYGFNEVGTLKLNLNAMKIEDMEEIASTVKACVDALMADSESEEEEVEAPAEAPAAE